MPPRQPMVTKGYRLPAQQIEWLRHIAEADGRTPSEVVRGLIAAAMAARPVRSDG